MLYFVAVPDRVIIVLYFHIEMAIDCLRIASSIRVRSSTFQYGCIFVVKNINVIRLICAVNTSIGCPFLISTNSLILVALKCLHKTCFIVVDHALRLLQLTQLRWSYCFAYSLMLVAAVDHLNDLRVVGVNPILIVKCQVHFG